MSQHMTAVIEENLLVHKPFSFGKIDPAAAMASTLSMLFMGDKLIYTIDDQTNTPIGYGLVQLPVSQDILSKELVIANFPLIELPFKKVWAAVSNTNYSLIPNEVYQKQHNTKYLSFALGKMETEFSSIKSDNLFLLDMAMVYSISSELESALSGINPGTSIRHEKSILATQTMNMAKELNNLVLINLCDGHFDLVIADNKNLLFLNSFPMTNTEEILYYLFDVLKQLELKIEDFHTKISGLKPLFFDRELVKKYVPTIKELQIQHGEIYTDSGLYFIPHYLSK